MMIRFKKPIRRGVSLQTTTRMQRQTQIRVLLAAIPGIVLMTGCLNDSLASPSTTVDNGNVLASVTVWPRAVTLARGASQQLMVTAKAYDGTILSGATTTFTPSDTIVQIDSTGLLTGITASPWTTTMVLVRTTYQGVTRIDTAVVRVTETAEAIQSLSIAPANDADRYSSIDEVVYPEVSVYRPDNSTVDNPLVWFDIVTPGSGVSTFGVPIIGITFGKRGSVWVRGSAVLYGKEVVDSIEYVVGYPRSFSLSIFSSTQGGDDVYAATSAYLGLNGTLSVTNYSGKPITVTFSDSTMFDGGNMTVPYLETMTRTVVKEGEVRWTLNTTPVSTGVLVVK